MKECTLTPPMRILASVLEGRTGQTLSDNRLWRLETSLKPTLRAHGLATLDELAARIGPEPRGELATQVVNALLNNETSFFRDAHIFQLLARDVLPEFIRQAEARGRSRVLRLWCAGCSTGQEAYSLAMMFHNHAQAWPDWRMKILATDVSSTAIERARSGLIPQMEVQRGLAINDLLKWMEPEGDLWRVHPAIQEMIDFRVDNLFGPKAPAGEYDLVLCRNVLLYFSPERKKQLLATLASHSAVGGFLLLGAGETVIGHSVDFTASQRHRGVYERIDPSVLGANI